MHSSDIFNVNAAAGEEKSTGSGGMAGNGVAGGREIFSIGGSPSFRIQRRMETNSSVFPAGCMGNLSDENLRRRADQERLQTQQELFVLRQREQQQQQQEQQEEEEEQAVDAKEALVEEATEEVDGCERVVVGDGMGDGGGGGMYQYEGSNIARNPLTGHGMSEEPKKHGKRLGRATSPKWLW